jgi:hypothetical protein
MVSARKFRTWKILEFNWKNISHIIIAICKSPRITLAYEVSQCNLTLLLLLLQHFLGHAVHEPSSKAHSFMKDIFMLNLVTLAYFTHFFSITQYFILFALVGAIQANSSFVYICFIVRCLLYFVRFVCTLCCFSYLPLGCWLSALINRNWLHLSWTVKPFSIRRVKFIIIIIIIIIFILSLIHVTLSMSSCQTTELCLLLSTLLLLSLSCCYWWMYTTILFFYYILY